MSSDDPTVVQTWTIGRLLTWTTDYLRDKGADSPRLDAEVLLAHARDCPRIELYTAYEEEAPEPVCAAFRELVRRRAEGVPVAYLVGHREFFSLSFHVTPDVLIPRPETELLVVRAIDLAKEFQSGGVFRIADVGTGSGILAVTCAKHVQGSSVLALDICPAALVVARRNADRHGVAEHMEFLQSDLFSEHSSVAEFDLILSNPPYVTSAEMGQLDADVRDHEPHLALDGGEQGTTVIEQLIPQATERLRPSGWLLMEVGPTSATRVEELVDSAPGLIRRNTISDLAGHPRVVQAVREND
ncbi:MAG: peptide chain release factor N(5)-glutamine methyltransferase [Pirellulales bacterium]|nr:peptide chain release factor N(5)-glutamine methyltransferase [Pirellulales bacterium]